MACHTCFARSPEQYCHGSVSCLLLSAADNGHDSQTRREKASTRTSAAHGFVDSTRAQVNLKRGGQRVATVLMYLEAAEEGGETHFPEVCMPCLPSHLLPALNLALSSFQLRMKNALAVPGMTAYCVSSAGLLCLVALVSLQAGSGKCKCGDREVKGLCVRPQKGDAVLFWSAVSHALLLPLGSCHCCPTSCWLVLIYGVVTCKRGQVASFSLHAWQHGEEWAHFDVHQCPVHLSYYQLQRFHSGRSCTSSFKSARAGSFPFLALFTPETDRGDRPFQHARELPSAEGGEVVVHQMDQAVGIPLTC